MMVIQRQQMQDWAQVILVIKKETMPVWEKEANELGIYDMSGNVSDWTNTEERSYLRVGNWHSYAFR